MVQAKAHEKLGQLLPREKHAQAYQDALKDRFKHMPEVKRILRHRHLPAVIYKVPFPLFFSRRTGTVGALSGARAS